MNEGYQSEPCSPNFVLPSSGAQGGAHAKITQEEYERLESWFLTGSEVRHFLHAFQEMLMNADSLAFVTACRAVEALGVKPRHGQSWTVAAEISGSGKTHHVLKQAFKLQDETAGGEPVYHRVEFTENTDAASLALALLADPTDPRHPTVIHVNLAQTLPRAVDGILFQLIVLGVLHDTKLGVIYHRRDQDMFFIEVPSAYGGVAQSMPFLELLPRETKVCNDESLEYDTPKISDEKGDNKITIVRNDDLILVGKYLAALEAGTFDLEGRFTNEQWNSDPRTTWTSADAPEINTKELYRLVQTSGGLKSDIPSFLMYSRFANLLARWLRDLEKFPVGTNVGLQRQLHYTGLKKSSLLLMIETAWCLSCRQIPKAGTKRVNDDVSSSSECRFARMAEWEDAATDFFFVRSSTGAVQGFVFYAFDPTYKDAFVSRQLKRTMSLSGVQIGNDNEIYEEATWEADVVKHLLDIEGTCTDHHLKANDYKAIIAGSDVMRLAHLQQRLKCGFAVCLMDDTGCNNMLLARFVAQALDIIFMPLSMHGGTTEVEIIAFMDLAVSRSADIGIMIFLHQINCTNCVGLFKTLIVDRVHRGKAIPQKIRIVASFKQFHYKPHTDSSNAHPLDESLIDIANNFGISPGASSLRRIPNGTFQLERCGTEWVGIGLAGEEVFRCPTLPNCVAREWQEHLTNQVNSRWSHRDIVLKNLDGSDLDPDESIENLTSIIAQVTSEPLRKKAPRLPQGAPVRHQRTYGRGDPRGGKVEDPSIPSPRALRF